MKYQKNTLMTLNFRSFLQRVRIYCSSRNNGGTRHHRVAAMAVQCHVGDTFLMDGLRLPYKPRPRFTVSVRSMLAGTHWGHGGAATIASPGQAVSRLPTYQTDAIMVQFLQGSPPDTGHLQAVEQVTRHTLPKGGDGPAGLQRAERRRQAYRSNTKEVGSK